MERGYFTNASFITIVSPPLGFLAFHLYFWERSSPTFLFSFFEHLFAFWTLQMSPISLWRIGTNSSARRDECA